MITSAPLSAATVAASMSPAASLPAPSTDRARLRANLDEHGYCLLADALDPAALQALRSRIDEQAAAERDEGLAYLDGAPNQDWGSFRAADGSLRSGAFDVAGGGVNQRIWMLVNKGQPFIELLGHENARELITYLLGEEYLLSSYTANIANPGGVAMQLHTDQWWMPAPTRPDRKPLPVGSITRRRFDSDMDEPTMLAPPACCNIIWMLDDFTHENGATRLVPGSHLFGRQPDHERDADVVSVPAAAPAGSALITDGRVWHGTGANQAHTPRRGVLTTFCGPQFRSQENFTLGTDAEVLRTAPAHVRALLGFKVWGGYGRIESPVVEFVDRDTQTVGALRPKPGNVAIKSASKQVHE